MLESSVDVSSVENSRCSISSMKLGLEDRICHTQKASRIHYHPIIISSIDFFCNRYERKEGFVIEQMLGYLKRTWRLSTPFPDNEEKSVASFEASAQLCL